ncbi:MAG: hypothetical protein QW407_03980 [Thermofilaceae archaeon]
MCPIVISDKKRFAGTLTPQARHVETTVVEIPQQDDDYIVEGYLDLRALTSEDTVVIKEYVALDGTTYSLFASATYVGQLPEPLLRFHSKVMPASAKYKVTLTQTSGEVKSFPYFFVALVMGTA